MREIIAKIKRSFYENCANKLISSWQRSPFLLPFSALLSFCSCHVQSFSRAVLVGAGLILVRMLARFFGQYRAGFFRVLSARVWAVSGEERAVCRFSFSFPLGRGHKYIAGMRAKKYNS